MTESDEKEAVERELKRCARLVSRTAVPPQAIERIAGSVVPPLEAYVEGPPEVEVTPLHEEPVPIVPTRIKKLGERPKIPIKELVPIIERLKANTYVMTQLRVDFDGEVGWVVPEPRYTLIFKKPKGRVVGKLSGARDVEELKEYQRTLEAQYPEQEIKHRWRDNAWEFLAFPPERKIYRADPYLMAKEVVDLYPHRLTIQTIPRIIRLPKGIPLAEALPRRRRYPVGSVPWEFVKGEEYLKVLERIRRKK